MRLLVRRRSEKEAESSQPSLFHSQDETQHAGTPSPKKAEAPNAEVSTAEAPPLWRVGLIVTASALCGGIAVVLWNRRLLTKMRDSAETAPAHVGRAWDDDA